MSEPAVPEQIGPYRILSTLGEGGMGLVFRAEHGENGEEVALKTVRVPHQSQLASIRAEVHALGRIRHPGVVRIVAEGVEDGLPWYAMELLIGRTLAHYERGVWEGFPPRGSSATRVEIGRRSDEAPTLRSAPALPVGAAQSPEPRPSPSGLRGASPGQEARRPRAGSRRCSPSSGACATPLALHSRQGASCTATSSRPTCSCASDGTPVLIDFGLVSRFRGAVGREVLEVGGQRRRHRGLHGARADPRASWSTRAPTSTRSACILYELVDRRGRPSTATAPAR